MMKKIMMALGFFLLTLPASYAAESCFLAKENGKVLKEEGECKARYAPESTFKIALSLIGFDAGILQDEHHPSWPCKAGYDYYINVCKSAHTPRSWMRDSCLWYSRVLTQTLGMDKFSAYVGQLRYGNGDLSGDKGKNNGLTHAWISSSLRISPEEQTEFLQNVIDQAFPFRPASYHNTKKIMFLQELSGGWKLYGKTGNGRLLDAEGNKTELQHGWFVGYIEKGTRRIVFASHIADESKQPIFASFRARNEALNKLWYLIDELEK